MAAGLKTNLAENRAIHASEQRGVNVPPPGSMAPLKPGKLGAPRPLSAPKTPKTAGRRRKYYGE